MVNPRWLSGGRTARILASVSAAVLLSSMTAGAAVAQPGGTALTRPADGPSGFWEGTDSWPITIGGSPPYHEPAIGGDYGGYIGMTGNWAYRLGCHGRIAFSNTNAAQAYTNFTTYHMGIGTGVYWFMGGPGVDPHYNGSTTEAYNFGAQQAAWTLGDVAHLKITYPVIFEDVEIPGIAPAPDNGWNSVYTSPCSGRVRISSVPTAVDRADFNGFAAYITSHSSYKVGVYSAPGIWTSIFGTGVDSQLRNTYEWTYTEDTSSLNDVPHGWCLQGTTSTCAGFFGGQHYGSKYLLMWQWSGGGGTFNGFGDFDQIDASNTP